MLSIELFGDKIILEDDEKVGVEKKTEGGLFIPATAAEDPDVRNRWAKVLAVGDEVKKLKVGDVVMYDKFSTARFVLDGENHLIAREQDLVGKRV